ncbi:hypothetical protein ACWERV_27240 [Streptomyces sp. NPDC004031]
MRAADEDEFVDFAVDAAPVVEVLAAEAAQVVDGAGRGERGEDVAVQVGGEFGGHPGPSQMLRICAPRSPVRGS